jgi:hypothetical protein
VETKNDKVCNDIFTKYRQYSDIGFIFELDFCYL